MGRGGNSHQTVHNSPKKQEFRKITIMNDFRCISNEMGFTTIKNLTYSVVHRANEDFKKCALLIPDPRFRTLKIGDIAKA